MKRSVIFGLLAVCLASSGFARASGPVKVSIEDLSDSHYRMDFETQVQASSSSVWGVLTDFDHHAQYLPHLNLSRIVEQNPDYSIVDEEGKVRYLFLTFGVRVKLKVIESPITQIQFQALEGDFALLSGVWTLSGPENGPTRLDCSLTMQPRRHVPAWAVHWAARKYLGGMVKALAKRAERG